MQLIEQGLSPRQAMIKAGYSVKSAGHPKGRLFMTEGVQTLADSFLLTLENAGVTHTILAKKYAEWLNATEVKGLKLKDEIDENGKNKTTLVPLEVPDYHTQLEAGKMLKEIMKITPKESKDTPSRRITLEEFINTETSQ